MNNIKRKLVILAGPNGAGKSTAAPDILRGALKVNEFVNADTIAQGLSAFSPEGAAFQAGRTMLKRIYDLASRKSDFAFETTLASRSFKRLIVKLKQDSGYQSHLVYLWLRNPDLALYRVKVRVEVGGHNVPEEIIRRRYKSGLLNFFNYYLPILDNWYFYDNSSENNYGGRDYIN